jgi:hypothetical protein
MFAAATALGVLALCLGACSRPVPPVPEPAPPARADGGAAQRPRAPEPFVDDPVEPLPQSTETVTLRLIADAKRQAQVFWGRKLLGVAPLEIKRPRASGPMDLLVTAPGYLPLHTRVFTDKDETLALRLYTDRDATGLLGYTPPPER